jgi:hypothetical protein
MLFVLLSETQAEALLLPPPPRSSAVYLSVYGYLLLNLAFLAS